MYYIYGICQIFLHLLVLMKNVALYIFQLNNLLGIFGLDGTQVGISYLLSYIIE